MYNDEDLQKAVNEGILSSTDVANFRAFHQAQNQSNAADQENFRLLNSFNDVFVVIALALLLSSVFGLFASMNQGVRGLLLVALICPLLSEFYTLKRHMALPSIMLMVSCLLATGGFVFAASQSSTAMSIQTSVGISAVAAALAAAAHWGRYRVPITPALIAAALVVLAVSALLDLGAMWVSLLICGTMVFCAAMWWDARDVARLTRSSDVAFWLHLLAAPLICHSIFGALGGDGSGVKPEQSGADRVDLLGFWLGVTDHRSACFYGVSPRLCALRRHPDT